LVFLIQKNVMAKNTSILLGEYFDDFIQKQIQSGKYSSASEAIRSALRLFEHEERKKEALINALKKGEHSGFISDFDRMEFLNELQNKHT